MNNIFDNAIKIIEIMEQEQLSVREFITAYSSNFEPANLQNLIPPECREHDFYSESAYVFVIGSYIYQMTEKKTVTWFERRRFAEYPHFAELFIKTLSCNPKRRTSLSELKKYLEEVKQNANAFRSRNGNSPERNRHKKSMTSKLQKS